MDALRLVDNHSHILLYDIGTMTLEAKRKGLSEYSITEHVSQFKEPRESIGFGSVHNRGRIFRDLREYNREFEKVKPESSGLRVNRGLEVDFSPRYEKPVSEFVNQEKWDILLCSVHEFADGTDIEKKAGGRSETARSHQLWRDYLQLETQALESEFVPFQVLTHPVRLSRVDRDVPPELDGLLLDLARLAKSRGKALELNGNDMEYAPDLVRSLAVACSKAGCTVSLGSDAHHPREVARNIQAGQRLVDEFRLEIRKSSS